jgi:hypothetical protein
MRIQIIEADKKYYDPNNINSLKEICDVWVSEYGAEKLDWLHAATIDDSCDVFIQPLSPTEVQIGFLLDASDALSVNNPIHSVNIIVLDTVILDALTQTLLITVGMNCIQSVTGSFSVDWADVRAVLGHGTMAYCVVLDWNTPQHAIEHFKEAISQLQQPVDVVGCAMLLNQGLRIVHTYEKIQSLTATNVIPADCLTITNMTNSRHIPQTNILMFVCKLK